MESIIVALITGGLSLLGAVISSNKSRAVMEVKIDDLKEQVEKHNSYVERTYKLEQDVAVAKNDIEALKHAEEKR